MKLDQQSQVDVKKYPILGNWDQKHRENYQFYQNQIDQYTYGLQRAQRGNMIFGDKLYPVMYQKDLVDLELLQLKQWLGEIEQEEVNYYKEINPQIAHHYNSTFRHPRPYAGLMCGSLGFILAHQLNVSYSFRLSIFVLPIVYDYLYQTYQSQKGNYNFHTIQFMKWLIQFRKSKAVFERNSQLINHNLVADYQKNCGNLSVQDALSQIVQIKV